MLPVVEDVIKRELRGRRRWPSSGQPIDTLLHSVGGLARGEHAAISQMTLDSECVTIHM